MCVFLCASRPVPCPSWQGVRCGGVCSGLGCSRAPPLLAGVLGRVCVCVRAPLVPRHSWLGCAVWACVLGLDSRLCHATLGWGVGVCVCSCVCPACTPPFLAGWCVCVWVWVSSALRLSPGLGAGARGLLCAPRLVPITIWGAACGLGICGCCRGWGLSPPLPLRSFFRVWGGVVFGPVLSRICGVCRWLAQSWVSWSLSPLPLSFGLRLCVVFFARLRCSKVCVGVFGVSLLPLGCCSRFAVAGFSWVVLRCSFGGSRLRCCLAGGFALLLWYGWAVSWLWAFLVCPPPFFLGGGVRLFLPLPSLGWCTHWSALGVVDRVAVGACVLLGLVPAPWVGWVMYTLGSVALPVGLGSGSAGWAVARGGFVRPWVRGAGVFRVPPPPRCRL